MRVQVCILIISMVPSGDNCVLHARDRHTPIRAQVWAPIRRNYPLKRQHFMLEGRFLTHRTERVTAAMHFWETVKTWLTRRVQGTV